MHVYVYVTSVDLYEKYEFKIRWFLLSEHSIRTDAKYLGFYAWEFDFPEATFHFPIASEFFWIWILGLIPDLRVSTDP